jgi:hypothetical protein
MNTFYDLSQALTAAAQPDGSLGKSQKIVDDRFPSLVSMSPLRLWYGGNAVPTQGKRLLIGVATWSAHDMKLLDAVAQALQRAPINLTVDVFNVADCSSPEAFDRYVPGIGRVFQTPVVGFGPTANWSTKRPVERGASSWDGPSA